MVTTSRAATTVLVATAILLSVLVSSCTRVIDDARVVAAADMGKAAADGSECTSVEASLTAIPDRGDEEPVMKIPQPQGWERSTVMDSELIRFAMANRSLAKDNFASNAVVTLEGAAGIEDPAVVFESQRTGLEVGFGATGLRVTQHTLCGLPAETVNYQTPVIGNVAPHPAVAVIAVLQTDDMTFAASVTVQSTDADNPTYQRDAEMIATGFQMLPPSGA